MTEDGISCGARWALWRRASVACSSLETEIAAHPVFAFEGLASSPAKWVLDRT